MVCEHPECKLLLWISIITKLVNLCFLGSKTGYFADPVKKNCQFYLYNVLVFFRLDKVLAVSVEISVVNLRSWQSSLFQIRLLYIFDPEHCCFLYFI